MLPLLFYSEPAMAETKGARQLQHVTTAPVGL